MIGDGGELALVDVREELIFSQRHLLLARSIPLSRLELKFAQLVPRRATRIVLCDDGDSAAGRAAAILARNGYQVITATNAADALDILQSEAKIDLLFSDVVMPLGIDGVELAREAKLLDGGIKVLLTSGNAADVLARHDAEDEFPMIGKPYRRADLAQYLRLVMRGA